MFSGDDSVQSIAAANRYATMVLTGDRRLSHTAQATHLKERQTPMRPGSDSGPHHF
jgi:hypothetical protein